MVCLLFWWAELDSGTNSITVFYGLVRGNIRKEVYAVTQKDGQKELESRYNDKIKQGYTYLNELCDMQGLPPVEDGDNDTLFNFLNTYLPKDLSNGNSNLLLPMLAKTYSGNVWKKVSCMYGQYKINGLRCIVTAYTQNDMFKPIRLRFQSREGLTWHTLSYLEDYLLETRLSTSHIVQQEVLFDSQSYIGRTVHIEYGERSGVARVPFHIKTVVINGDIRL